MKKKILFALLFIMSIFITNVKADTILQDVTVNLPAAPAVGADVVSDFSVPNDAGYTVVTWHNGKLFIDGYTEDNKYVAGEDYRWNAVVCPKEGYEFDAYNNMNFTVNGFDITDNTIVNYTSVTVNADTCRGLQIFFQPLPGTAYKFLTTPSSSTIYNINNVANLNVKFSADATLKLQKYNSDTTGWVDLKNVEVLGNQSTNFTVPAETDVSEVSYRLNYNDKRFAEFKIYWVDPTKVLSHFEVTLPKLPKVGATIDNVFSIPEDVNYTLVTWNDGKMFINGDVSTGKYLENETYTWGAVVCPKDDYSFAEYTEMTYAVHGISLNDSMIYSHSLSVNGITCRGVYITFKPLEKLNLESATVTGIKTQTYNGLKQRQNDVVVTLNDEILVKDVDYQVLYSNLTNAGTIKMTIKGINAYTGTITKTFTRKKAKNTLTVKAYNKTVYYSKVKKSAQVVKPITIVKKQGTVTYTKLSGSSAKLTINKTTGKVTVKKGTKKGKYKIKIKVYASGNTNYFSNYTIKTVYITVK